ncbi:MAG: hypothetical protein NVS2B9_10910 [Myxococcales bacterium]
MDQLRVPKQRVEVELLLLGAGRQRVAVFLAEFSSVHEGRERLADLLSGQAEFIPAVDPSTNAAVFVRIASIGAALAGAGEALDDDATLPTEHEVEVTLQDGQSLSGVLSYVRPPERSRIVDFLNDAPGFFPLMVGDRVAFINKRRVTRVVEKN